MQKPLIAWLLLTSVTAIVGLAGSAAAAQDLKYAWEAEQKFSFNMTITVEDDERITTFKGTVHYAVDAADAEQLRFTYRGGLPESSQLKQTNRNTGGGAFGGPFGPRGFPRPGFGSPGSPFSRPAFAGKIQTTNRITMTPTGRVLALEGDSQLPYLLGNVSLLPFEMLPKGDQREWTLDSGVSISEQQESRRPFGSFGPHFQQDNKSVQAATEITRYSIQSQQGNLITIKKSYQLTAAAAGDGEAFDMNGAGTWVFDIQEHLPQSLDMNYKLIAKEGNSSTTFPISVKFTRLTAAELAKMEADAQREQEERQRKLAEEKAKAETPLTEEEKRRALASLAGRSESELKKVLAELETKSLAEPDPDITSAIARFVDHPEKDIREAARKALAKWSATYKRKFELANAYEGPSPVTSTDREVDSTTRLYVGQIVQVQEHGSFWFPARIKSLPPSGKVEVEFLSWGKPSRDAVLARRNLQLAPEELDQPARPRTAPAPIGSARTAAARSSAAAAVGAASSASTGKLHTWSDASGRFNVQAEFVGFSDGKVTLRREDGRTVDVPLNKLSPTDQARVQKLIDELASENPFEPK